MSQRIQKLSVVLLAILLIVGVLPASVSAATNPSVRYRTHVENIGWQSWKSDGEMSGTSSQGLRLEGIEIDMNNQEYDLGVTYQTHIQNIGWESDTPSGWKSDGMMSGTEGLGYRLEAIQIKLTGADASKFDIYYQVHAQNIGWMGWAKNGESAGTAGFGYRLEGIEITIVPKDSAAPGSTEQPFVKDPSLITNVTAISLNKLTDTITVGGSDMLVTTILPEDADNKTVKWSSSDPNVATVDATGIVTARNIGTATITATTVDGNKTATCVVTVDNPNILTIDDLSATVMQYDSYNLPKTVLANMSNDTTREVEVVWNPNQANTTIIGAFIFEGTVVGYNEVVKLTLNVQKYQPNLNISNYSAFTINNLCKQLSLNIQNNGSKPVTINKIEVYEQGKLANTYTASQLTENNISTSIAPAQNWGMTISYKLGIWIDNSYVKYYLESDGSPYEYTVDIK
ncbi:MAG: Ig-like domain-containing protein [Acetobacterium sp.]|uniref:Ig-like domain-containing protein n=1 Tax=Acetobacterium sp. TaxID=1872094 RepID=UPI003241CB05